MKVLQRIIGSQKAITTAAGAIAVTVGAGAGLTDTILQLIGALFGLLVGVQGLLDYKHGSPSDGTGNFSAPSQG